MATAESVAAKLEGLISAANAATGKTDADLTAAVSSLIAGFGGTGTQDYDMGEFILDSDTRDLATQDGIRHQLGEVPGFVFVWSEEMTKYTQENPNTTGKTVFAGYMYMKGLFGIPQRLTTSATNDNETFIGCTVSNNDYRVASAGPSSATYCIKEDYTAPSAEKIGLPAPANANGWIAGITYKFLVARKWWQAEQEG